MISFFQTLLTILIVRVIDIEDDNEIANKNNVKTKGKLETIDITYAKCSLGLTLIFLFLF